MKKRPVMFFQYAGTSTFCLLPSAFCLSRIISPSLAPLPPGVLALIALYSGRKAGRGAICNLPGTYTPTRPL